MGNMRGMCTIHSWSAPSGGPGRGRGALASPRRHRSKIARLGGHACRQKVKRGNAGWWHPHEGRGPFMTASVSSLGLRWWSMRQNTGGG
ncbi:hypothetical protein F751_6000 [Auxenochlorella protothecoides]|uniref:Uncharacterized protein n=1 Tax=Auxenochlorella protothecoides TaxID=3075 RepID=A0A087SCJ2_AUXPR|nr:hypothetical protein F751_6000 [Auxenochlorella protothecoides]KFM23446.1 hypothetical protein F751_6000 [Auxenochlorella protothecoides]